MGLENTKSNKLTIKYICLQCKMEEEIPKSVVDNFDAMDGGDLSVPPRFTCNKCHGEMVPENYEGVHGIQYEYDVDT